MSDKVLVVIPTKNRPMLCARAVETVLQQAYQEWDCLLVKNGPYSLALYREDLATTLHDQRVHIIETQRAGLGFALNYGLSRYVMNYDYFAVLEDDDEWDPEFLETLVRVAVKTQADVAHCLQRQVPRKIQSDGGPMDFDRLRHRNWVNWPECLFKADLYARIGKVCESCGPATDWDWHLRCAVIGAKYAFVNKTLVVHHWHQDNYCLHVDGKPYIAKRMREGIYG